MAILNTKVIGSRISRVLPDITQMGDIIAASLSRWLGEKHVARWCMITMGSDCHWNEWKRFVSGVLCRLRKYRVLRIRGYSDGDCIRWRTDFGAKILPGKCAPICRRGFMAIVNDKHLSARNGRQNVSNSSSQLELSEEEGCAVPNYEGNRNVRFENISTCQSACRRYNLSMQRISNRLKITGSLFSIVFENKISFMSKTSTNWALSSEISA